MKKRIFNVLLLLVITALMFVFNYLYDPYYSKVENSDSSVEGVSFD